MNTCLFCALSDARVIISNDLAIADGYPVSPGHTLIIPKRKASAFATKN
jgi:diadenosine tetraphosphate (Ap4A) HIT family hydrolase